MNGLDSNWPQHPLFKDLDAAFIAMLARTATEETYKPREIIFHEGEDANKFYLVCKGNIAVEIFASGRGPVTIETIGEDEVLGWSWLIEPYKWFFDAQAVTDVKLIAFDAMGVREYFENHREFAYTLLMRFVPVIAERVQATRLQLLDLYHVHS